MVQRKNCLFVQCNIFLHCKLKKFLHSFYFHDFFCFAINIRFYCHHFILFRQKSEPEIRVKNVCVAASWSDSLCSPPRLPRPRFASLLLARGLRPSHLLCILSPAGRK